MQECIQLDRGLKVKFDFVDSNWEFGKSEVLVILTGENQQLLNECSKELEAAFQAAGFNVGDEGATINGNELRYIFKPEVITPNDIYANQLDTYYEAMNRFLALYPGSDYAENAKVAKSTRQNFADQIRSNAFIELTNEMLVSQGLSPNVAQQVARNLFQLAENCFGKERQK